MRIVIAVCLFAGFVLTFYRIGRLRLLHVLWQKTRTGMDEAERERLLRNRNDLLRLQRENSLWFYLEKQLLYSGLQRRFPLLTLEVWILGNVIFGAAVIFLTSAFTGRLVYVLPALAVFFGAEAGLITLCKVREMRSVEENLLKFLDFLGNYSLTAGEITGIFGQISKYVEEPLRSALDSCCYEAQTTGDVGLALLAMSEKIEHPKFREIVKNIEISCRYTADFTGLVSSSRRSVREYLRMSGERKGMLREALLNLFLLLGMSLLVFVSVDHLIDTSIWDLLFHSLPGRGAMAIFAAILFLFGRQMYRLHK